MISNDLVTLVSEEDQVIGTMDKIEAHRSKGKLHRASSVFLFRKNEGDEIEFLVQKRSEKKIVGAGQWANTVCGNVWPDESYEACARRRLSFELGINDVRLKLNDTATFRYQAKCNEEFSENEIVHIFIDWYDAEVNANSEEVAEWQWVKWEDAHELKKFEKDWQWAPWFELFMKETKVIESLNRYLI
jgi:isopentenyl-diphosphate delta-isomerase